MQGRSRADAEWVMPKPASATRPVSQRISYNWPGAFQSFRMASLGATDCQ